MINLQFCCGGLLITVLLIWSITGYAFSVNAKLPEGDPKKRNFHPGAIIIAPFTLPIFFTAFLLLFIVRAILFGIFLITYALALITFRKPFIFKWLDKIATKIGNRLLEANSALIQFMLGDVKAILQLL